MPKYDKLLYDKYSNTVFLILLIITKHFKFDYVWNHIYKDPNMANNTTFRQKRGIFSTILISFLAQQKV